MHKSSWNSQQKKYLDLKLVLFTFTTLCNTSKASISMYSKNSRKNVITRSKDRQSQRFTWYGHYCSPLELQNEQSLHGGNSNQIFENGLNVFFASYISSVFSVISSFLSKLLYHRRTGPSCSKLTTSLVNDSLKFASTDIKYAEIFCWKNVSSFCSAKATHIFSAKNIRILHIESAKTVNEMTLNGLVKLTMLWTTGPRLLC